MISVTVDNGQRLSPRHTGLEQYVAAAKSLAVMHGPTIDRYDLSTMSGGPSMTCFP